MIGIGIARGWAVTACLALLGLATGGRSDKPAGTTAPAPPLVGPPGVTSPQDVLAKLPGGDEFAAGKKVYADNKCANCHKLGDTGGGGGGMMAGALLTPAPGATGTPVPGPPTPAPDL